MDAADFRVLFEYNAWANRRVLDACGALTPEEFLQDMKSSFASVRDTLAHIYGAEFVWLERWNARVPSGLPSAGDFPDLATVRVKLVEMDAALIAYVSELGPDAATRTLCYKLLNGTAHSGQLGLMLLHVANHSTYHRGQVTTMLRQLGVKSVGTDLILYYREIGMDRPPA